MAALCSCYEQSTTDMTLRWIPRSRGNVDARLTEPKELGEGYVLISIVLVQQMDSLLFVKIGLESQLLGLTLNLYQ